jgi:hypothetical protein
MNLSSYDKGLAVRSLVLLELRDGSMNSGQLATRLDQRCSDLAQQIPGFDFVGWGGATLWELLDSLLLAGFVSTSGERSPRNTHEWALTTLYVEGDGERFLANVRCEAPQVMALIEAELALKAAAS